MAEQGVGDSLFAIFRQKIEPFLEAFCYHFLLKATMSQNRHS
jgi:hypothetical protein